MKLRALPLVVVVVIGLLGCASSESFLPPGSQPSGQVGYVAARFTLEKRGPATAFVLTNLDTRQEFVLPFTSKIDFPEGNTETALIALPPGRYKATHWIVYNTYWGPSAAGRDFKRPLSESNFTAQFSLQAGEVTFLGQFVAKNSWTAGYNQLTTRANWVAEKLTFQQAQDILRSSHPKFGGVRMSCLTCS